jgi:hypothetical protein
MPGRLGPRFALEAVFLIALAVAMGLADLTATAIIVVMAVAWVLVALVEWLASRGPDYGAQSWDRAAGPRAAEPESVTELVPPPPPPDEEEAETGDPIAGTAPVNDRKSWFARRRRGEESRMER